MITFCEEAKYIYMYMYMYTAHKYKYKHVYREKNNHTYCITKHVLVKEKYVCFFQNEKDI